MDLAQIQILVDLNHPNKPSNPNPNPYTQIHLIQTNHLWNLSKEYTKNKKGKWKRNNVSSWREQNEMKYEHNNNNKGKWKKKLIKKKPAKNAGSEISI